MARTPLRVRFTPEDDSLGEFTTGELADITRATRVAIRGLTPGSGKFAGGYADIIDVATGETLETVALI